MKFSSCKRALTCGLLLIFAASAGWAASAERAPNIIFVLVDDQRYDEIGLLNPQLETPNLDRLATEGVFFRNAFVTTSLCSPSRATILTGQYMHDHGVVDNNAPFRGNPRFFPMYLQESGYQTAFVGKWHMGGHKDDPQPGFDHWVSFAGQGHYMPVQQGEQSNQLNINGKHTAQKGYITDELTDYAIDWLGSRADDQPFFLYLSHKAVHANFEPAERHKDQYSDLEIPVPASQADTPENYAGKPLWVKNQRNSWHGVDFPYHTDLDVQEYKRDYHRALSAVDDSMGRILAWLEDNQLQDNTLVVYMGDNGFLFGEHGLIDKRNAYEESIRVPMIAWGPGMVSEPGERQQVVANLDVAPTLLDAAGLGQPEQFSGRSFLPLIASTQATEEWRDELLYEYYWEFNFPHTPTTFALRTDRFKLIQYHGVWDTEELYDLVNDPREMNNLIDHPDYLETKVAYRQRLYDLLANANDEHVVPYTRKFNSGAVFRNGDRSEAAEFPVHWLREDGAYDKNQSFYPDRPGKDEWMRQRASESSDQ